MENNLSNYQQFCPMAMAYELLCKRWTIIILRELHLGSSKFNQIKCGVPRISPTLLSRRLKELEADGLLKIHRNPDNKKNTKYLLTNSGKKTFHILTSLGEWGKDWFKQQAVTDNAEPQLLMWDLQRNIKINKLPQRKIVIQFIFSEVYKFKNWWLIYDPKIGIDLGMSDPGLEIDAIFETSPKTLAAIHMGYNSIKEMEIQKSIKLMGDPAIIDNAQSWLGTSYFGESSKS